MAGTGTWLATIGAAALLVTGCGSSAPDAADPKAEPRIAVVADALRGPGTALADGIDVQEGSRLVGAAFPFVPYDAVDEAYEEEPDGWEAVFVVDGEPMAVWERYADALGIGDQATAERSCVVGVTRTREDPNWHPDTDRLATEARLADEDHLTCSATVGGTSMAMAVGVGECPDGYEDLPVCPRWGMAHLHVRVDESESGSSGAWFGADDERTNTASVEAQDEADVADTAPLPGGPLVEPRFDFTGVTPLLPGAGERIDAGLDPFLGTEDYVAPVGILPKGARSLVSPGTPLACAGALATVVEVPGTAAEAVAAFDAGEPADLAPIRTGRADGVPWAQRNFESAGGYYVDLTAVPAGEGRSFVLYTECGD